MKIKKYSLRSKPMKFFNTLEDAIKASTGEEIHEWLFEEGTNLGTPIKKIKYEYHEQLTLF